jgi:TetR/AcrR family transcriptional regulator
MSIKAPTPAKSEKGERRREQIVTTARRCFMKNGYEGLSMRQVASQCDINLKNLQYYFPTKEDLFVAIIQNYYADTLKAMKSNSGSTRGSSGKLVELEKIILDHWDVSSSAIWTQLYSMAHHSNRMRELKIQLYDDWCTELAGLLKEYYPEATGRKLSKVARILTALIDGVVFARTEGSKNSPDFAALEKDIQAASKLIVEAEMGHRP